MDRRKFLVGLGSLAAGGAAASGTGAFTAATMDRNANLTVQNDGDALIALKPGNADGAGERVRYNDGRLYIDFSSSEMGTGVNDDARYQVGAMDDDNIQGDPVSQSGEFVSLYDDDTAKGSDGGAAGDGRPAEGDPDKSAFIVENRTDHAIDLEIGWQGSASGAKIWLQAEASDITGSSDGASTIDSATNVKTGTVDLDNPADATKKNANAISFDESNADDEAIPSGESVYVSFQVDTEGGDTDDGADLTNGDGALVVNAEATAEPGQD
jgi:hypothetical protein